VKMLLVSALGATMFLTACDRAQERAQENAEDQLEQAAELSAAQTGATIAALNLTERQLLDADLVDPQGRELGDIVAVVRGSDGQVERLLIEIEDSDPDRFVQIPLDGLTTVQNNNDWDVVTTMTRAQIIALPDAPLTGAGTALPPAANGAAGNASSPANAGSWQ